jgi:proline dehydrogenase
VLQAYLRRSVEDARKLISMKANIRLCKGIYIEPHAIAFRDREEVRRNFVVLMKMMLEGGSYVGIATHDDYLIDRTYEHVRNLGIGRDHYEFQMLLGVKEATRNKIVNDGHRLRVYVPFGERWYAYSVRRLKENPQIAGYIVKSLFLRNGS